MDILADSRTIVLVNPFVGVQAMSIPAQVCSPWKASSTTRSRYTLLGTAIVVRAGPAARLSVLDDADGVAPEHPAWLKHRFWRGDGTRSKGSGVGVSPVDRVAHARHGVLDVASGPGSKDLSFEIALGSITPRRR